MPQASKTYSVPQLAHSLRVLGVLISLLTLGANLTPEMIFHLGVRICPDLFYRYQWPYTRTCQAALPGRPVHLFLEGTNPSQRSRAPEYRET